MSDNKNKESKKMRVIIKGVSSEAQENSLDLIEIDNNGKETKTECLQYINEHGFEIALLNATNRQEIQVVGRPLSNIRVEEEIPDNENDPSNDNRSNRSNR